MIPSTRIADFDQNLIFVMEIKNYYFKLANYINGSNYYSDSIPLCVYIVTKKTMALGYFEENFRDDFDPNLDGEQSISYIVEKEDVVMNKHMTILTDFFRTYFSDPGSKPILLRELGIDVPELRLELKNRISKYMFSYQPCVESIKDWAFIHYQTMKPYKFHRLSGFNVDKKGYTIIGRTSTIKKELVEGMIFYLRTYSSLFRDPEIEGVFKNYYYTAIHDKLS